MDQPFVQYAAEEVIAAEIDTLIFVTGRNKRAIEDHFDNNQEIHMALLAKGKSEPADMVKNIRPTGVECIFVCQTEQLGLGHAVLCADRAVGNHPFAVLLAEDFLTFEGAGVTPDIAKYGVVLPNETAGPVLDRVEKPESHNAPSNLASIGRYVFTPDIFDSLR